MNIKRMLKKEAKNVLPDESLKQSVKSSVLNEEVTSVQTNVGTTMSISNKRNIILTVVISIMVLAIIASTVAGVIISRTSGDPFVLNEFLNGNTYLNIQINPGFEIMVDEDNRVTSVTATNKDGALVIYGTCFKGMPLEKALNRLMKDSTALGFVNNDNKEISIISYGEDNVVAKNVGTATKNNIGLYLKHNSITKTINMISPTREEMVQLGADNKVSDAEKLNTMTSMDIARSITGANSHEANKVSQILRENLNTDEIYLTLRQKLKEIDRLEDSLEDILDYIEDIIGEAEEEEDEEDENEEDEHEEVEEEDERETLNVDVLKNLIARFNALCIGDFAQFKYTIPYADELIDEIALREIQTDLIALMGDDDNGTGVDGLEDKLEDEFNQYKKEFYKQIPFDDDED